METKIAHVMLVSSGHNKVAAAFCAAFERHTYEERDPLTGSISIKLNYEAFHKELEADAAIRDEVKARINEMRKGV